MKSIEISSSDTVDLNKWDQSPKYAAPNWEVSRCKVWEKPEGLETFRAWLMSMASTVALKLNLRIDTSQGGYGAAADEAGKGINCRHEGAVEDETAVEEDGPGADDGCFDHVAPGGLVPNPKGTLGAII